MRYEVVVQPVAEAELEEAYRYIWKDSPERAMRWRARLLVKAESLGRWTERCPLANFAARSTSSCVGAARRAPGMHRRQSRKISTVNDPLMSTPVPGKSWWNVLSQSRPS